MSSETKGVRCFSRHRTQPALVMQEHCLGGTDFFTPVFQKENNYAYFFH